MIERNIYHDSKLIVTRCYDTVTTEELNESKTWMIQNFGNLIKPGFSQLFNTTEADIRKITEDDIHHIAHINISFSRARGKFTMAILAMKKKHTNGWAITNRLIKFSFMSLFAVRHAKHSLIEIHCLYRGESHEHHDERSR